MNQETHSCGCNSASQEVSQMKIDGVNVKVPCAQSLPEKEITSFAACGQSKTFPAPRDEPRWVEPKIDFVYPELYFPSNRIFKVFGEANIRAMVFYHHSLLKKTTLGHLFAQEEKEFMMATEKTADFFVEALGGGDVFTPKHGHPALRMRHFRFDVDEAARDIWLAMYKKTLKEVDFPKELLEEFWNWIEPLSIRMINRRTTTEAPARYFWADVKAEFGL